MSTHTNKLSTPHEDVCSDKEENSQSEVTYAAADCACCPPSSTVVNNEPKLGRNDPCFCGSGRKYKKCCF